MAETVNNQVFMTVKEDQLIDLLDAVHQVISIYEHSAMKELFSRLSEVRHGDSAIRHLRRAYATLLNDKEHAGGEG